MFHLTAPGRPAKAPKPGVTGIMPKGRKPRVSGTHMTVEKPELNEDGTPKTPVEEHKDNPENIDFEKELKDLEGGSEGTTPATPAKPARTEAEKAEFTLKSTAKRLRELGKDPAELLGEDPSSTPPAAAPVAAVPVDTSGFVTKLELQEQDANKLARSPQEAKVIMWYVKNKGLSVTDAHFLANKGRISKVASEIERAKAAVPTNGPTGAGERTPEIKIHKMNENQEKRLQAAGMVYDQTTKSYVGKKTRVRHNGTGWVSERLVNGTWQLIPDAKQFDE